MTHPLFVGLSYGMGENKWLRTADVILVLDSDIPWIPLHNKPRADAQIFHIDVDVLKQNMGMYHLDAEVLVKADCELALGAILTSIDSSWISEEDISLRRSTISTEHDEWISALEKVESPPYNSSVISVPHIVAALRKLVPPKTLFFNESVSNFVPVWSHLRPSRPGSCYTSGASSLGWGLGAAIGGSIGKAAMPGSNDNDFVALIVGDGTFLFGVPSSAYWIARRYETVSAFLLYKPNTHRFKNSHS